MKKFLLLAALLCALINDSFAQSEGYGLPVVPLKIYGGVKVGVNFVNVNSAEWDDGYKANVLGGLFLGLRKGRFGAQIEGLFVQSTYHTGTDFYDIPGQVAGGFKDSLKEGSFRVNQLAIPLLAQVRVAGPLWLQAGPQFSGVVSVSDPDELVNDAKGLFKSGYVSGVVGATISVNHINAGARYVFGLSGVNDFSGVKDSWKEKNIQLHIGYSF